MQRMVLEKTLVDMNLIDNVGQTRAVCTVAEHFITQEHEQLLLYIGGVRGTGKSHIINVLVHFFNGCGASDQLMLLALIGIAAILIKGHTIHTHCLSFQSLHLVRTKKRTSSIFGNTSSTWLLMRCR